MQTQHVQQAQHQHVENESKVMQIIKENEVTTGKLGSFFSCRKGDEFKMVLLTIENGHLVVDGRELLDMSKVEILIDGGSLRAMN